MKKMDKFKAAWKKQDVENFKYSYTDIQEMLHKKSSSIVKWIFYISIAEFLFWTILSLTLNPNWDEVKLKMRLYLILGVLNALNYIVIIVFIILFYKNYKSISASSNVKKLMKDILKTRKTVYYYVLYNVAMLIFGFIVVLYFVFTSDDFLNKLQAARPNSSLSENLVMAVSISILLIALIVSLLLLFYRIIYGILLKRLKQNYKELSNS